MIVSATSEKAYLCCLKEAPHVGCETSRHVFKDDRLSVLHNRIPFVETNEEIHDTTLDICGMDCEMVYTTQGFELARLCVVDKEGITVIDELCKTKGCVIDLNTIYSGITTLQDAKYDLESLRDHLLTHVNKDTVVVGHGLENDLKVLRVYHFRNILYDSKVIHLTVIDTSILFPFPNRPTYKYGLKMLAKFYLGIDSTLILPIILKAK